MRQFQNVPLCPISAPPMSEIYQQAQILILEILNVFLWLIRLRRIAFLDLEQISKDFEIEHFETASYKKCRVLCKIAQKKKGSELGALEKSEKLNLPQGTLSS